MNFKKVGVRVRTIVKSLQANNLNAHGNFFCSRAR